MQDCEISPKKLGDHPWKMGDHPREVCHPNEVESYQKSIGTIRCYLAITYNNWQRSLIFLETENKRTKPYIEAACCQKIRKFCPRA